jgi:hypothetical protein
LLNLRAQHIRDPRGIFLRQLRHPTAIFFTALHHYSYARTRSKSSQCIGTG